MHKDLGRFDFANNVLMDVREDDPVYDAHHQMIGYVDDVFLGVFDNSEQPAHPFRRGYVFVNGADGKTNWVVLPDQIDRVEEKCVILNVPASELITESYALDKQT